MTFTDFRLGHRPALDGLRGAAVALVLLGHLAGQVVPHAGSTGVNVFLVLSGFLITTLLVEERERTGGVGVRRFYVRRALRLLPAITVVLLVTGLYAAVTGAISAPVGPPALYVANVAMAAGQDLGSLGHTWSLSLEEQFYVVWPPLLLLALRRSRTSPLVVAIGGTLASLATAAAILAATPGGGGYWRVTFGPDTRSYGLLLGCALALAMPLLGRFTSALRAAAWPAIGAVLLAALLPLADSAPYLLVALPAATLAAAVLLVHLLEPSGLLGAAFSWGPLRHLGRISYGVYLWHMPLRDAVEAAAPDVPAPASAVVVAVASVAVAMASFQLLEQPFLRLKDRLGGGARPAPAESGSLAAAR